MPNTIKFLVLAIVINAAGIAAVNARTVTPMEECAQSPAPLACLDSMLRQVNMRLNAALKSAQERIEKLQQEGRRPVQIAFVNSQRQFNAFRDANCAWQAIAAPPSKSSEFVKDCQIRLSLAREQQLLGFARGTDAMLVPLATMTEDAVSSPPQSGEVAHARSASEHDSEIATAAPAAAADAPPRAVGTAVQAAAGRGTEWRLLSWVVHGAQRELVPDSSITIAFDPAGRFAGNASVNAYSGRFRFGEDGGLDWPRAGFTMTRMTGTPALMKQERAFLEALRRMVHYQVTGENLVLESATRKTVLTFGR